MSTRTHEQTEAFEHLRHLARPGRLRVIPDGEGFPIIPGRLGQVEWFTSTGVAVYSAHPGVFRRLAALPGVTRHQVGSTEIRYLATLEGITEVAGVIRARRRRPPSDPGKLLDRAVRATSGP